MTIPRIPLIFTAMVDVIGKHETFNRERGFAAWLGLAQWQLWWMPRGGIDAHAAQQTWRGACEKKLGRADWRLLHSERGLILPDRKTNGHARPCNIKPQQRSSPNVLR